MAYIVKKAQAYLNMPQMVTFISFQKGPNIIMFMQMCHIQVKGENAALH